MVLAKKSLYLMLRSVTVLKSPELIQNSHLFMVRARDLDHIEASVLTLIFINLQFKKARDVLVSQHVDHTVANLDL